MLQKCIVYNTCVSLVELVTWLYNAFAWRRLLTDISPSNNEQARCHQAEFNHKRKRKLSRNQSGVAKAGSAQTAARF